MLIVCGLLEVNVLDALKEISMKTSGNNFEAIVDEVLKQKQVLEQLLEENKALQQELAALRAGKDLYVEILGHRIPLILTNQESSAETEAALKEDTLPTAIVTPADQRKEEIALQETTAIPDMRARDTETAESEQAFVIEEVSENGVPITVSSSSTFLEDELIDEFSNAATRQMGVWTANSASPNPISNVPAPSLGEEEKAALRRELMGSFLLE